MMAMALFLLVLLGTLPFPFNVLVLVIGTLGWSASGILLILKNLPKRETPPK